MPAPFLPQPTTVSLLRHSTTKRTLFDPYVHDNSSHFTVTYQTVSERKHDDDNDLFEEEEVVRRVCIFSLRVCGSHLWVLLTNESELAMDEMVTVYVGKDNKAYRVQQALLCSASSWFRKAQFVKSDKDDTLELRLPDAEFDVFEDFLCWLFHRKMQDRLTKLTCMVAKAKRQAHTSRLVRTWVFGDKYSIPRLQNATVRELVRAFDDDRPSAAVISQVYETTAKGSKLRKLFAKQAAVGLWVGSRNGIESG